MELDWSDFSELLKAEIEQEEQLKRQNELQESERQLEVISSNIRTIEHQIEGLALIRDSASMLSEEQIKDAAKQIGVEL